MPRRRETDQGISYPITWVTTIAKTSTTMRPTHRGSMSLTKAKIGANSTSLSLFCRTQNVYRPLMTSCNNAQINKCSSILPLNCILCMVSQVSTPNSWRSATSLLPVPVVIPTAPMTSSTPQCICLITTDVKTMWSLNKVKRIISSSSRITISTMDSRAIWSSTTKWSLLRKMKTLCRGRILGNWITWIVIYPMMLLRSVASILTEVKTT